MMTGAMNRSKHFSGTLFTGVLFLLFVSCQDNQQQTVSFAPDAISLGSIQIPGTWSTHTLYSAFSLSVPNTMERSSPNDRWSQRMNNMGVQRDNDVVIFQQKTLNKNSVDNADEHYCRVLVNYAKSISDELLHSWETEKLDADTRAWLLEEVKGNLAYSQQLLSSPTYEWVDIGGTNAIRIKYRRSGNNGHTTACAMYYLYNYDEVAFVMTAYSEQEARLWQADMENVIRTFRWNRSK